MTTSSDNPSTPEDDFENVSDESITFHYLKSSAFRVIHVDGVWGGFSSDDKLHISFWNERPAIPRELTFKWNEDGTIGPEIEEKRQAKDGIVREVEVMATMSIKTAQGLMEWLRRVIAITEDGSAE